MATNAFSTDTALGQITVTTAHFTDSAWFTVDGPSTANLNYNPTVPSDTSVTVMTSSETSEEGEVYRFSINLLTSPPANS